MKTKILVIAGIVAAGVLVAIARQESVSIPGDAAPAVAAPAVWLNDFKTAQDKAQAENKPMLVDFTGSDWCPPCIMLEKQVFSQPEFADYAAGKVVLVKIDFPRRKPLPQAEQAANEALAQRYGIRGFPTILVMNPDGSVKGQLGFQFGGPAKFAAKVDEILKKS